MAVYHVVFLLFTNYILVIHASYHWMVTESGKIQSQVKNSGFPLKRPDDLMLLLEQEQRINAITRIYQELVSFKRFINSQWVKIEGEDDLEKRLYSTDTDCLLGAKPLTQHDLTVDFVDYGQGSRPKMKSDIPISEPNCAEYSKLDFSMMTFPHLKTLNKRDNLTVNPTPLKKAIQFDINAMLKKNHSDWTAYNIASFYWRMMGNGTNALECARRAIYFSPRDKRHIVLLNLGTLLQELETLGEAAIVLHSAVDHDPLQYISHLALGNVYAALGDYSRSLACYENVLSLYPDNERATQLKHAIFCQEKLESGLLEIHSSLQTILQDLQEYHEMKEKWFLLQDQVNWNKDDKIKDFYSFSQPLYLNLRMLLSNVEKQSLISDVSSSVLQRRNLGQITARSEVKEKTNRGSGNAPKSGEIAGKVRAKDKPGVPDVKESSLEDDDGELEVFDSSEYMLRSKMNSLVDFIKLQVNYNYDADTYIAEFKRKIRQQIKILRNLNGDSHFSADQTYFLNSFDNCLTNHDEFKLLNECFMRVLNMYSLNVSNRIEKLKEKIQLMKQDESKKNHLSEESPLENYIEVNPEVMLETEPSCQRLRDTTEL